MKNGILFIALFTIVLIGLLALISPINAKAEGTPTITVPTVEAKPGEKVSIHDNFSKRHIYWR